MTTATAPAPKEVAALLVIGDKILSGGTKDKNIGYIAEYLTALGIDLNSSSNNNNSSRASGNCRSSSRSKRSRSSNRASGNRRHSSSGRPSKRSRSSSSGRRPKAAARPNSGSPRRG